VWFASVAFSGLRLHSQTADPVIDKVISTQIPAGIGDTSIDVFGRNFSTSSKVAWNGGGLITTMLSDRLRAQIPASLVANPATASITVVDGDRVSNAVPVTVTANPLIDSVVSTQIPAGAGDSSIDVFGRNFSASSKVAWNGRSLITTMLAPDQLRAQIPAALVASPATASITVINGDRVSNAIGIVVSWSYLLAGLNYSPYLNGPPPPAGPPITDSGNYQLMSSISALTKWVRTFSTTGGQEATGRIAHWLGLKAAVGAFLSGDHTRNELEISNLISLAMAREVDIAIVGSEVLRRADLPAADLLTYIQQVRRSIPPDIPVTTADIYGKLLEHPEIISSCDILFANFYPYWEGSRVDTAIASLHRRYAQLVAASARRPVVVSETGWPSEGNVVGSAVPSIENASLYFLNFVSWARENTAAFFYFEAFDESWKAEAEGPQGAHFGISTPSSLKPGMAPVFYGTMTPDNWTFVGGPGAPEINFTYVPNIGSRDFLSGQVLHVKPEAQNVVVYIRVDSRWWIKPTSAAPLTVVQPDGRWTTNIVTGGHDELADEIVAYLVPDDYVPPILLGSVSLPSELDVFPKASVHRP